MPAVTVRGHARRAKYRTNRKGELIGFSITTEAPVAVTTPEDLRSRVPRITMKRIGEGGTVSENVQLIYDTYQNLPSAEKRFYTIPSKFDIDNPQGLRYFRVYNSSRTLVGVVGLKARRIIANLYVLPAHRRKKYKIAIIKELEKFVSGIRGENETLIWIKGNDAFMKILIRSLGYKRHTEIALEAFPNVTQFKVMPETRTVGVRIDPPYSSEVV